VRTIDLVSRQHPRHLLIMAAVMSTWMRQRGDQAIRRAIAASAPTWRPQG